MPTLPRLLLCLPISLLLTACDSPEPPRTHASLQAEPGEALSGGATSVSRSDHNAFSQPSANLAPSRRLDFAVGNSFFRNPWVLSPATTTARDGLGPLFNTNACQNCHVKDGRGRPPEPDSPTAVSALVRLSIPATDQQQDQLRQHGLIAEPVYGGQLQDHAVPGVEPEGRIRLSYQPVEFRFADGHVVTLQRPQLQIDRLAYGELHPDTRLSLRVAPPMIGLGLLEAIAEADLLAHEDPDDRDGDGISGRANRVWDIAAGASAIGRFGWKAGQPSLNQQNADAFLNDMGLSTPLKPGHNCTPAQTACLQYAALDHALDVTPHILQQVLFYTRNLAVPQRRNVDDPQVLAGKALFQQAGCSACHVPTFTTASTAAEPELAGQRIHPYTDLLLHDMGDGLADNHGEFLASGREWRTPPLWGIGLTATVNAHTRFLHDGRARDLLEAVLWHDGEAAAARERVRQFDAAERAALLAFLNSL